MRWKNNNTEKENAEIKESLKLILKDTIRVLVPILKGTIGLLLKSLNYAILLGVCLEKGWLFTEKVVMTNEEFWRTFLIFVLLIFALRVIRWCFPVSIEEHACIPTMGTAKKVDIAEIRRDEFTVIQGEKEK